MTDTTKVGANAVSMPSSGKQNFGIGAESWKRELEAAHQKLQVDAMRRDRHSTVSPEYSAVSLSPDTENRPELSTFDSAQVASTMKMTAQADAKGTSSLSGNTFIQVGHSVDGVVRREILSPGWVASEMAMPEADSPSEPSLDRKPLQRQQPLRISAEQLHLLPSDEGLHLVIRHAGMTAGDALRLSASIRQLLLIEPGMALKVTLNGDMLRDIALEDFDADGADEPLPIAL